jgi:acyl-CoA thioester hydrolase
MKRPSSPKKDIYKYFIGIETRWNDNDSYGHVNNAIYYEYMDTVVNNYLIEYKITNSDENSPIGFVVSNSCNYFRPVKYPDTLNIGLRIIKIGTSSVTYDVGIFKNNETEASARGSYVHVYVDKKMRKPICISDKMKKKLNNINTL